MCFQGYNYADEYEETSFPHQHSFSTIKTIVDMKDKKKLKCSSIQKLYPRLHPSHISRFRKYVEQNGTFSMKVREIEDFVANKFKEFREQHLPVHDRDLRTWSIQKSQELGLSEFKGSNKFLTNLKKRLRISSRRVTTVVTRRYAASEEEKQRLKTSLLTTVNGLLPDYSLNHVLNSDQSGFNYEYVSTRTLSHTGERKTLQVAKSISNTTHSYTIQPIVSAAGKLLSPMLICLQETTGNQFGPRVAATLEALPENIHVVCSKSGKLMKSHVQEWSTSCLSPHLGNKTLLLMDSWIGQSEDVIKEDLPDVNNGENTHGCTFSKSAPTR